MRHRTGLPEGLTALQRTKMRQNDNCVPHRHVVARERRSRQHPPHPASTMTASGGEPSEIEIREEIVVGKVAK